MDVYKKGYKLKEDEYLLKVRDIQDDVPTGFMTKFNKDGSIPKAFENWGHSYYNSSSESETIYIFKEEYRSGWKINDFRIGKSQNWATMEHPLGFTVEIYLDDLLDIILSYDVLSGEIKGEFKWEGKRLIEKIS